jgi:hypothetical protein
MFMSFIPAAWHIYELHPSCFVHLWASSQLLITFISFIPAAWHIHEFHPSCMTFWCKAAHKSCPLEFFISWHFVYMDRVSKKVQDSKQKLFLEWAHSNTQSYTHSTIGVQYMIIYITCIFITCSKSFYIELFFSFLFSLLRMCNHKEEETFTVRVIHSLHLRMSVIQIMYLDKMVVVSHLIGAETLPTPDQVSHNQSNIKCCMFIFWWYHISWKHCNYTKHQCVNWYIQWAIKE